MTYEYSEDGLIEQATQDVLQELGWEVVTALCTNKTTDIQETFLNL